MMLRALASDQSNLVRQTAASALAKNVEDTEVARALMQALKTDTNNAVRLTATAALAKRVDDADVYALLVETAKNDVRKSIRARALDALAPRLATHADLRPIFMGYLDDESVSMQYHALKGLVGLNDPALRQRLIDKSRDLILLNGRRNWNDQLVLNVVLLLRKLDPQEADRALDQLAADRERMGRF
jgi:HEAT repeat protein